MIELGAALLLVAACSVIWVALTAIQVAAALAWQAWQRRRG